MDRQGGRWSAATSSTRWSRPRSRTGLRCDMHGALLESRLLPPGSDLKRVFVTSMPEHMDAGRLVILASAEAS